MSGFSREFFNGDGGGPNLTGRSLVSSGANSMIGGNPNGTVLPFGFQQQQQQQHVLNHKPHMLQQQQQQLMLQEQIAQRKGNMLMGKRSFVDFQQQQQQQIQLFGQQQQQQQMLLQRPQLLQQQQLSSTSTLSNLLKQQYLMRSVKPRINTNIINNNSAFSPTIDLCSPTYNNNNNNISSSTRFGVPVYQQSTPLFNNLISPTNINTNNNSIISQGTGFSGYSHPAPNFGEAPKVLNTLEELEKQLLADDDNDLDCGDAVSGVTNSEWSDAFHNIINPDPFPNPNPAVLVAITSCSNSSSNNNNNNTSNNNTSPNNNNNVISPSPTSSTSSCCSTSASATGTPTTVVTASARDLITEAAAAISEGKPEAASEAITKLAGLGNCKGNAEQRLAYYMCNALKCRVYPNENPPPVIELYSKEQMGASYSLYDVSPCFKFGLLAANLVMLDAITSAMYDHLKVHVIDFDIGHGGQYINLLRALSERRGLSPHSCGGVQLKITVVETELGLPGVADSVREGLVKLAEGVGIKLSFARLTRPIHELTRESLGCEVGEAVVVNFAFKLYRVPDESVSMDNLRDELLRRVKGLSPRAITLVEQDMNGNTAPFMTRVNEVCGYYGALFDSLEATLPRDNPDRCGIEEGLGLKMANSVACEGRERVERAEVFGKWRARMSMAGFELKPFSRTLAESMRVKLSSGRGGNPGFTVKEENGGVGFGWMGRTLTVASTWR